MQATALEQRRKHARHAFRSSIRVAAGKSAFVEACAINMSLGGMCFEFPHRISRGDRVRLRVFIDGHSAELNGVVRHTSLVSVEVADLSYSHFLVGVEFVEVEPSERSQLASLLANLPREEG